MKLCDLKNGERARIIKIGRIGELKKRGSSEPLNNLF